MECWHYKGKRKGKEKEMETYVNVVRIYVVLDLGLSYIGRESKLYISCSKFKSYGLQVSWLKIASRQKKNQTLRFMYTYVGMNGRRNHLL